MVSARKEDHTQMPGKPAGRSNTMLRNPKTFTKDRDHSLVEVETGLTHGIDHTFEDRMIFAGSCKGSRAWYAPDACLNSQEGLIRIVLD